MTSSLKEWHLNGLMWLRNTHGLVSVFGVIIRVTWLSVLEHIVPIAFPSQFPKSKSEIFFQILTANLYVMTPVVVELCLHQCNIYMGLILQCFFLASADVRCWGPHDGRDRSPARHMPWNDLFFTLIPKGTSPCSFMDWLVIFCQGQNMAVTGEG